MILSAFDEKSDAVFDSNLFVLSRLVLVDIFRQSSVLLLNLLINHFGGVVIAAVLSVML